MLTRESLECWDSIVEYTYYNTWKDSQTILILHWWRWSSDSWKQVWELLHTKGYNVIIPDIPCASTKTVCQREFSLEQYAKLIEEFYNQLKLENIILWGHSNGWALSMLLSYRKNLQISQLILNNSAGIRHDAQRSFKRKVLWSFTKVVKDTVGTTGLLSLPVVKKSRILFYKAIWWQDYLEAEKNDFLHKTYINMIETDLLHIMPEISTPTTLIWWEKDSYTPVSDCHTIIESIPGSKKIVLDWETHWIHLKSPERLVQTFISSL